MMFWFSAQSLRSLRSSKNTFKDLDKIIQPIIKKIVKSNWLKSLQ